MTRKIMSTKKIFRMSHRLEEIRFKYLYYTSRSVTCVRLAEAVRCLEDEEGRKGGRDGGGAAGKEAEAAEAGKTGEEGDAGEGNGLY
eukprot:1195675-Prorocentrum_minimum.AAC.7